MKSTAVLIRSLGIAATLGLFSSTSLAATLASYQFATNLSPTTQDGLVTADALSGAGTARSSGSYAFQYPAAGNSGYMQFTITADAGYVLDLSQLNFAYYFPQTAGTVVNVTGSFSAQYSLDGFATAGVALTSPQSSHTSTSGALDTTIVIGDFSSASYTLSSIPDAAAVSFRIMLANNGSLNTNSYRYSVDNLSVLGSAITAIPEPSTYGVMAGMTVMVMAGMRRQARRGEG